MLRTLLIAVLLTPPALLAQNTPFVTYDSIRTPEIQLGSGTTPTIITTPPVVTVPSSELYTPSPEPQVSTAPPASTELLASRHFDFIISPVNGIDFPPRGNMADTSISLGEYARQLRAQKQRATTPNAIAQPADSKPNNSK